MTALSAGAETARLVAALAAGGPPPRPPPGGRGGGVEREGFPGEAGVGGGCGARGACRGASGGDTRRCPRQGGRRGGEWDEGEGEGDSFHGGSPFGCDWGHRSPRAACAGAA